MEGAADVAEINYTPFGSQPGAAPVRLIVRRVRPTPGSQLALFASYSYHAFITDREGDTLELEADHRRHAEVENTIRDLKYGAGLNHLPSGRFPANGAWLAVQVMAHNLARWTGHIAQGDAVVTTKTLRRRFFSLAGRITRKARRLTPASPQGLALGNPVQLGPGPAASHSIPGLTAPSATGPPPDNSTSPDIQGRSARWRCLHARSSERGIPRARKLYGSCGEILLGDTYCIAQQKEYSTIKAALAYTVSHSLFVEFLWVIRVRHSPGDKESHNMSRGEAQSQDFLHGLEVASGCQKIVYDSDVSGHWLSQRFVQIV